MPTAGPGRHQDQTLSAKLVGGLPLSLAQARFDQPLERQPRPAVWPKPPQPAAHAVLALALSAPAVLPEAMHAEAWRRRHLESPSQPGPLPPQPVWTMRQQRRSDAQSQTLAIVPAQP